MVASMTQDDAILALKSGANVFLTGGPGSGKSYVLSRFAAWAKGRGKAVAVTASTGIAAAHIGGMTVHAWSGLGTRSGLSLADLDAIGKNRRIADRVSKADVLVIDEISMLSRFTLDAVNGICQHLRHSRAPFGGLQTVMVGDFFQLPPVVGRGESIDPGQMSQDTDDASPFAYNAHAWRDADFTVCYLTDQHRQTDATLTDLLTAIRAGDQLSAYRPTLQSRVTQPAMAPKAATRLHTHNVDVDRVNAAELETLKGEPKSFFMETMGDKGLADGLKRGCLSPERLDLKPGASVMFTKNDPDWRYVNGTLGTVTGFEDDSGHPVVRTAHGAVVVARPTEWKVTDADKTKAGIVQVPLRLAWAITVHKSQGMSLDAAVIDLSRAFEYGQGYVALSRVRTLDGLHLLGWNERALRVDPRVLAKDYEFRAASGRM
jgi:nucleoside-triphosphatase THEP1